MMDSAIDQLASDDFNRARTHEIISRIISSARPSNQELLSLNEVKEAVKPKSETYRGMQTVPIEKIVGSEGRYRDFNRGFLPKREHSRGRWTSIDKAYHKDIILPPIRLYEIGGVYFVRDGNHRVSVAKAQGVFAIDAEVISLNSEVRLPENMTRENLRRAVLAYEREQFLAETRLEELVPEERILFTEPGRYEEMTQHIHGHKYFINQDSSQEISWEEAVRSWYQHVYRPIVDVLQRERLLSSFPGRTHSDLYVWIVKHWHFLKAECDPAYAVEEAAVDYSLRFGKRRLWRRIGERVAGWFGRRSKPSGPQDGCR